jgi:hypothetical protein
MDDEGNQTAEMAAKDAPSPVQSNVAIPQVQMERDARQMFAKQGRAEGVFPVKVQIPERGKYYRFTKLLVTDEVPELVAKYKK